MNYFDSTIRAGYYDAFQLEGIDHTYAILDRAGELWAFPCFGGVALRNGDEFKQTNVRYPVDLWTPYMIGSKSVGSALPANLHVALGMAQFRTNPAYNSRLSEWKTYWDNHIDGISCWAGIVYGVSGVCQQACNRILWATRKDNFTECPVNWPPSFSGTYWVYGYYGKTSEAFATLLASQLVAEAEASANISVASDLCQAVGESLQNALEKKEQPAERRHEIAGMIANAPAGGNVADSTVLISGLLAPDARFAAVKQELDKQLLRGEVTHDEYAGQVNAAFARMIEEFRNVLPASTFETLFPEGSKKQLIIRSQMPETYEGFQELACV